LKRGVTLLEVLLAVVLFGVFMTTVAFIFARSNNLFKTGQEGAFETREEGLALAMMTADLRNYAQIHSPNVPTFPNGSFTLAYGQPAFIFTTQNNQTLCYFVDQKQELVRGIILNYNPNQPITGVIGEIFPQNANSIQFSSVPAGPGLWLVNITIQANTMLNSQNNPLMASLLLPGIAPVSSSPFSPAIASSSQTTAKTLTNNVPSSPLNNSFSSLPTPATPSSQPSAKPQVKYQYVPTSPPNNTSPSTMPPPTNMNCGCSSCSVGGKLNCGG
jgi:prepilin-type N-terminal cleavage/methylation domain-containing protein